MRALRAQVLLAHRLVVQRAQPVLAVQQVRWELRVQLEHLALDLQFQERVLRQLAELMLEQQLELPHRRNAKVSRRPARELARATRQVLAWEQAWARALALHQELEQVRVQELEPVRELEQVQARVINESVGQDSAKPSCPTPLRGVLAPTR